MRRELTLGEEDVRALEALGVPWETLATPSRHLLVHDFPLPDGYNVSKATLAVRLDSYPPGMIDMAFFSPALSRTDGKPIGATAQTAIGAMPVQQWSRHYPWRQGEDTLATHLGRIRAWLRKEFRKR